MNSLSVSFGVFGSSHWTGATIHTCQSAKCNYRTAHPVHQAVPKTTHIDR